MSMRIDIDRYHESPDYHAGYDDGCDDGYKTATMQYENELRQLRDALRAMLDRGEAPERETSR